MCLCVCVWGVCVCVCVKRALHVHVLDRSLDGGGQGLEEVVVRNAEEIFAVLHRSLARRRTCARAPRPPVC